ncbi:MAG: flagellar basal body rod protein FlgC [Oscillospiraceae bacterium]|nr:flagellar basal body rod protein FlgC [Oscillospiraceae bacterium]
MFLKALNIPGSGLTAEQYRLNIIAQNISNVETTRTEKGGPYRRKVPVYTEVAGEKTENNFKSYLTRAAESRIKSVNISDNRAANYMNNPAKKVYANNSAYIRPNFNGYKLNSETLQTSGNFIKNKYPGPKTASGNETENGGVKILKLIEDPTPGKMVYDPEHPDANEEGYVEMPNVEMVQEMTNMMGASRSYEANVQVVNAMKAMATRALELGR